MHPSSPHVQGEADLPDTLGQDIFQKQEDASCRDSLFFGTKTGPLALELGAPRSDMTVHQPRVSPEAEAMSHESCCITAGHFSLGFSQYLPCIFRVFT